MTYSTTQEVLKYLGTYNLVRNEVLGTGNGSLSSWTASQSNLVSGSVTLYTNSTEFTGSYTVDYDNGIVQYTAGAGVTLSADYDYSDFPDSVVIAMISSSDSLIEERTGRKFTAETGNTDYISLEPNQSAFFVRNYPILTLSSVASRTTGNAFETLTEGYEEDYTATDYDLSIGRIRLNANVGYGEDRVRVIYDYGYNTTPNLINELSKLLTIRQLANSTVYKSIVSGQDNFTPVRLDEIEARIEELFRLYTKQEINSI